MDEGRRELGVSRAAQRAHLHKRCEQRKLIEEERKDQQLQDLTDDAVKFLKFTMISDPGYTTDLVHVLMCNSSVKHLALLSDARQDCDESPTTDAEWVLLLRAFQSPATGKRLKSLFIQDRDAPFYVIPTALWQFQNLQSLDIKSQCDWWEEEHWEAFSSAISAHPSLITLKMEQTMNPYIQGSSIDNLVSALATLSTLREFIQVGPRDLDDYNSKWQPKLRVASLTACLRSTSLEKLSYRRSGLRAKKADVGLMNALRTSTLLELSLSGNGIDQITLHWIAHGVLGNTSLKKLDLSDNDFGQLSVSARALATMLRSNKALTHLDLSNCNLNSIQFAQIVRALKSNASLVSMTLGQSGDVDSNARWENSDIVPMDHDASLDPGTEALLRDLQTLFDFHNTTLKYINVSTRDFVLDAAEECLAKSISVATCCHGNRREIGDLLRRVMFGLELNRAGRGKLVDPSNFTNRPCWVEALIAGRENVAVVDCLLRANPTVFFTW